ncbi:MAG: hypothetical protein ABI862_00925 [Ilumatobacteraceae bacterium]
MKAIYFPEGDLQIAQVRLQVGHTSEFDPSVLAEARDLLFVVFDDMADDDWEHALGGMHVVAWLGASDAAVTFYEHRGWIKWLGQSSALTPTGLTRTPDEDDCIFVLPGGATLDITGELTCDWRDGDVW